MTQASLASQVNLDQSAIAKIETRKRSVSAEEAGAIARALGVTVERLLDYPGADQDALLYTRVIAPRREMEARLEELRRIVSGSGDGTLQGIASRLRDGIEEYRAEVSESHAPATDREYVGAALAAAQHVLERFPVLREEVTKALDGFSASGSSSEPITTEEGRVPRRRAASRVTDRGISGDSAR